MKLAEEGSSSRWRAGSKLESRASAAVVAEPQRHRVEMAARLSRSSALPVPCSGMWPQPGAERVGGWACWLRPANQLAPFMVAPSGLSGSPGRPAGRQLLAGSSAVEGRGGCGSGRRGHHLVGRSGGQIQKALRCPDRRRWAGGCRGPGGFRLAEIADRQAAAAAGPDPRRPWRRSSSRR